MSIHKFENDSLKQTNDLQESLALAVVKFLMRGKMRKIMKAWDEDPEMIIAVDAVNKSSAHLKKMIKKYKGKDPNKKLPWE
tara:strand:+ start:1605 stop:1847 length:243 start_codon:yes stop_codon:yes gene_type:complete